ncbi:MAG: hypothetical protein V2I33_21910, partial [Kangiellaceae bacterium]|nr:hypothetical protein [Kangiellaceae bacterium]
SMGSLDLFNLIFRVWTPNGGSKIGINKTQNCAQQRLNSCRPFDQFTSMLDENCSLNTGNVDSD